MQSNGPIEISELSDPLALPPSWVILASDSTHDVFQVDPISKMTYEFGTEESPLFKYQPDGGLLHDPAGNIPFFLRSMIKDSKVNLSKIITDLTEIAVELQLKGFDLASIIGEALWRK
jgi:hypothetical protein